MEVLFIDGKDYRFEYVNDTHTYFGADDDWQDYGCKVERITTPHEDVLVTATLIKRQYVSKATGLVAWLIWERFV